jgi:hypothetical protein
VIENRVTFVAFLLEWDSLGKGTTLMPPRERVGLRCPDAPQFEYGFTRGRETVFELERRFVVGNREGASGKSKEFFMQRI